METYLVPTADARAEFVEKRSRFIGRIFVTETEEEALYYLKEMRQKHSTMYKIRMCSRRQQTWMDIISREILCILLPRLVQPSA